MSLPPSADTVIIGGGITGLAAAQRLAAAVAPFLLLESSARLGGKIQTEQIDGFVFERGPDCILAAKPAGMSLIGDLGLAPRLVGTDPAHRRTFVKRRGSLHRLPEGLTGLVPSRVHPLLATRLLSLPGRLRAGLELFVRPHSGDTEESIAAFVTRRFGREAYDWLVEPLLSGIYAGDGEKLSLEATFPQLIRMEREHGGVLRAMLRRSGAARGTRPGAPATGFVTFPGGLGELVEELVGRLPGESVRTGVAVLGVTSHPAGYLVETSAGPVVASRILLAVPADVAARILGAFDRELARELGAIPFVSTATVSLAFPAAAARRPPEGSGYVSPRAEGGPIVAATWTSNKFPRRARPGGMLVRYFLGRAGAEAVVDGSDESLVDLARADLAHLLGVTQPAARAVVSRWPHAMPQYVIGHRARLERIEQRVRAHPGLALAGASYRGVGIPDCIADGRAAVDAVLAGVGAAA